PSVRVPSRFANAIRARSAPRTAARYAPGDGGRVGVSPSMVSPAATMVTLPTGGGTEGVGDAEGDATVVPAATGGVASVRSPAPRNGPARSATPTTAPTTTTRATIRRAPPGASRERCRTR